MEYLYELKLKKDGTIDQFCDSPELLAEKKVCKTNEALIEATKKENILNLNVKALLYTAAQGVAAPPSSTGLCISYQLQ